MAGAFSARSLRRRKGEDSMGSPREISHRHQRCRLYTVRLRANEAVASGSISARTRRSTLFQLTGKRHNSRHSNHFRSEDWPTQSYIATNVSYAELAQPHGKCNIEHFYALIQLCKQGNAACFQTDSHVRSSQSEACFGHSCNSPTPYSDC